jgi:hypothetical protein
MFNAFPFLHNKMYRTILVNYIGKKQTSLNMVHFGVFIVAFNDILELLKPTSVNVVRFGVFFITLISGLDT